MKIFGSRVTWGLLLIAGGVLLLLQNLKLLPESSLLWLAAFGLAGLYFMGVFFSGADHWWAAFPAFALLGIAAIIALTEFTGVPDEWAGAVFLGSLGVGFLVIYLRSRAHWWPIIPGGALLTMAGLVLITSRVEEPTATQLGAALFGGLALTFLLVYAAPSNSGRARWAIWPAAGLVIPALFTGAAAFRMLSGMWPAALIATGIFVLLRGRR